MKKKIALLLLLALALTLVLAACKQTEATKIIPRWDEKGESYEYAITLADFNTAEDAKTHFNQLRNTDDDLIYYKDFVVRTGEPLNDMDEVRPTAVTGTFKLTIAPTTADKYDTVTTEQYLELTYENKDGKLIDQNVLVELQKSGLVVAQTGSSITLRSTTETKVVFKHDDRQAPKESWTKVKGFYLGKTHQEVSIYEISTTYNYEGKHAVAEIKWNNDTDATSYTIRRNTEGTFIDSNQLFTYTRSLDKSSTSFADSPSVSVYNPFNQTLETASFVFTASANAVLTDNSRGENGEQIFAKIPTVGVVVGGMPFMLQESVPNLKEKMPDLFNEVGNGPDTAFYGPDPYAKHTPVRFRVGYISFELTSYSDEIWNTLKATVSTEK